MPSNLLRARTAVVAGLAALSLGGVAAAVTGSLAPALAERASQTPPSAPGGKAASAHGQAATFVRGRDAGGAANGAAGSGRASDHATGPDASGAARHGLCQAWQAGQGDVNGRRADAPAFQALADAAGGADRVAAYCKDDAATSAAQGQRPAAPPGGGQERSAPPTTGPPPSPGNGHGQGGPPATT
jgi:hypothetical protein